MNKKLPIDKQREAAITLNVGGEDNSAIKGFLKTSNAIYLIKEESIYKVQLADDIDPNRTNPNVPNLSQRVLSAGYNNEIVARVLLTAKYLFDEHNAQIKPFVSSILEGSLELTKHVIELQEMASNLKDEILQKETPLLKEEQKANSFSLPSITDIQTRTHNIFIKADKAKDEILSLYRLQFLPDADKRPKLEEYDIAIKNTPHIDSSFITSWNETKRFFTLIRNIRNSSEHPKEGQKIILQDFYMNLEASINPPLVEIKHNKTPIRLLPLVELLDFLQNMIINYAESSLVFIRCTVLLNNNPFDEWVSEFDEKERPHPLVRYYRSINMEDDTIRILG